MSDEARRLYNEKLSKMLSRFEEAIRNFEKAIVLEPSDPEPHYELGKLYLLKADKKKTEDWNKKSNVPKSIGVD
ncbi:MAG: tetratricopeptide repeat protein [Clostridiales bacterium]|nr:tetratricopeptide repeat protein [Clostridiales bacterium]